MPPPIGRRRIEEFRRAFQGEINSLAALYRNSAADMLDVLGDATATLFARQRAIAHLRQYQTMLATLHDEAAAWIETNIPRAYHIGLEFADEGARNIRKAGVNLGRRQREVFSQVHREAAQAVMEEMLRTTDFAVAQIGRRVNDVFRRVGVEEVAKGIAEGKTRIDVSRQIRERLLAEGRPYFTDKLGRKWDLDRYSEMVARTTTREAMTKGTINRLREHGIELAQVSAHNAADFCVYYENAVVSIGDVPHPVYPSISSIGGGPPFHPRCVHVLTPFVERLATDQEKKAGIISPDVLNRSPAELQRRFRREFPGRARAAGRGAVARRVAQRNRPAGIAQPAPGEKPRLPDAPFANAAQAEGWMHEHYPEVAVDFRGVHSSYLTRVVSQWNEMAHEYPAVARGITYFGTYVEKQKMPEALRQAATGFHGEFAHAWYVPGRGPYAADERVLALNPGWFASPERLEEALKSSVAAGFHPAGCDTVESIITHEFGHHVHYWYQRVDASEAWAEVVAPSGWGLTKDTFNMWWGAWSDTTARQLVSIYGSTRPSEGFAEAFAALHHAPAGWSNEYADSLRELLAITGPNARRYARPQYRWLDELPTAGNARRRAWSRLEAAAKRMGVNI
jgi:hypothetical protein